MTESPIAHEFGLVEQFPEQVLAEANLWPIEPDLGVIGQELASGRVDLRQDRIMTIDGDDARDFDDAVDVTRLPDGRYRLGVHIADVAHYVEEHSALDREAARRGTSVYLVDRVLPMLPPRLSNGICSLNPHKDRLALSVWMMIAQNGEVEESRIFESVICSWARTTYAEVQHVLETGQLTQVRYPEFSQDLELMCDLAGRLARRRSRLGAIDFNLPETKIQLDERDEPVAISPDPQSFANKIIEVFMVAANETVARLAARHRLPFLYRVHDEPDPVKIKDLLRLSRVLGLKDIRKKKPSVADLSGLLEQSAEQPFAPVFAQQLLRAMARAEYRAQNDGHYGLASACYCHFTSPIRRYPDLVVHRIIKAHLRHRLDVATWRRTVIPLAAWCSCCERTAQKAEWASRDLKVAEYYVKRLGDLDEGIIAGFSPAGLIVRLSNSVEGMIPFRDLPQYVTFIPERLEAVSSTGQVLYRAGDRVKIQIARADTVLRRLDFALVTNRHQAGRQKANPPPQQAKDGKRRGRRRAADRR